MAQQPDPKYTLKMAWILLDTTTETFSAQGTDKQDFINLLVEVDTDWKGLFKMAKETFNNAEKTVESSRQLQSFLTERSKKFEEKFELLKSNQSQIETPNTGPEAFGATPPKKTKVEGQN